MDASFKKLQQENLNLTKELALLKESERKYAFVFKMVSDGLIYFNKWGKVVDVNPAATKITGIERSEIVGKDAILVAPKYLKGETLKKVLTTMKNVLMGTPQDGYIIPFNNKHIEFEVSKESFHDGIVVVFRDVTNQLEFERALVDAKNHAEECDRLKSTFLANMSHEIRTPMNAILGFSDLLSMEEGLSDDCKDFISIIKSRGEDLLKLINDILDISKIEAGQLRVFEQAGSVLDLFADLKSLHKDGTLKHSDQVQFVSKNKLKKNEQQLVTDFSRIKQVLINLLTNAFKSTAEGFVEVGVKRHSADWVAFWVKDTGLGIAKKKQQLIFERFRQADESYLSKKSDGTGLGLSISKGIVDLLHGHIWLESEEGKGATFYFTIPFKPAQSMTEEEKQSCKAQYKWENKTILVVEDDAFSMEFIKESLKATEATLLLAEDGKTAQKLFRKNNHIDMVLMDIRLPDTNGYQLIHKLAKGRKEIKFIAQTAFASEEDRQKSIQAGCVDFIPKPIKQYELLQVIDRHLAAR